MNEVIEMYKGGWWKCFMQYTEIALKEEICVDNIYYLLDLANVSKEDIDLALEYNTEVNQHVKDLLNDYKENCI